MNEILLKLGLDYTVQTTVNPEVAIAEAIEKSGAKDWRELVIAGWAGPIHHLIHSPSIRDIWVMHGRVIVRSKDSKSSAGIHMPDHWIRFLVSLWRNARNQKERIELDPLEIFRSTMLFDSGNGVRYLYQPGAFSPYGESLYVRRLPSQPIPLSELVRNSTMPQGAADLLVEMLRVGTPMIISGQTGAGKTTLIGSLLKELQGMYSPLNMLLIERSMEIPLEKPAYRWELDASGTRDLDYLAEKATQLGLEWMVIGECTGGEAYFAVKAFTQGVPMMTTLHADSSEAAYRRLGMLAIEYASDPRLLPMIMEELGTQGVVSVNLALREREEGLLGAVTGIDEMIGVSGGSPVINPLWQWSNGDSETHPGLRFNPGCVTSLSEGMKTRFYAARSEFPVPMPPQKQSLTARKPGQHKRSRFR